MRLLSLKKLDALKCLLISYARLPERQKIKNILLVVVSELFNAVECIYSKL